MRRTRHLRDDERGFSLVFVGLTLVTFLTVSALGIDVGMFMTARSQAQNAADAGALGAAVALYYNDYFDRSAGGPIVQSALSSAIANPVMAEVVSIDPSDVTFENDPSGQPNRVRVSVFRTAARGNPVTTLIAAYMGVQSADITAMAVAEAAPANAANCVLPFTIPDRWTEMSDPPWDTNDTFEAFPNNPGVPADVYYPATHPSYNGYDAQADKGLQVVIKAGTGNNIAPSFYFAWAIPGSTGASDYRWNIGNCNTTMMYYDDLLTAEPGNMVGPTKQGVNDLVAQDPGAYWDTVNNKVVSSMNPSPRVRLMPVFDPYYYDVGKQNGRNADLKAANFIGVFVEGMQGKDVVARITPAPGLIEGSAGPAPAGAFPRVIRLVE